MDDEIFDNQKKLSRKARRILFERVGRLGIKFGTRKGSAGLDVFLAAVVQMASSKRCAPTAVRDLKLEAVKNKRKTGVETVIRSEDWVLKKIRDVDPDQVASWCINTMAFVTRHAQRESMIGPRDGVAIDVTGNGYYGKRLKDESLKTKPKNGTSRFLSYMVSHSIDGEFDVPLSARRIKKGDKMYIILRKTVKDVERCGMRPGTYYMDRGFATILCILEIKDRGAYFLMPMTKNKKVLRYIREHHAGKRPAASLYTMGDKNGKHVTFNLLVVKKSGWKESDDVADQYVVFATNLPCRTREELIEILPEKYRRRWQIETTFRVAKEMQGKTCSNYVHVRMFLFYFALLLYSLWMMTKCENVRHGILVKPDWIRKDGFIKRLLDLIIWEKEHGNFL